MADDKSEKPTQERLKKSREKGQFLSSRGMLTAVQFITFVQLARKILPGWTLELQNRTTKLLTLALSASVSAEEWSNLMRRVLFETLSPLLLLGAILLGVTLAIQLSMTGFGFSLARLAPKLSNLSPLSRVKSLPGQNFKAVIEAVLLIATLGVFLKSFYTSQASELLRLPFEAIPTAEAYVADSIENLLWKASYLFIAFGAVDLAVQYRKHMKTLKMSKQEIRDEHKRSEGDPQTKNRIRRMRRELLRRQMMRQVPTATAVVVNPTHFAVAIRYEMDSMPCPIIVAKGKNWLALRIRHIATQNEIPIIENPPLARALYDAAEVGGAISPEFYKAIAEILAYVYRLMGRKVHG